MSQDHSDAGAVDNDQLETQTLDELAQVLQEEEEQQPNYLPYPQIDPELNEDAAAVATAFYSGMAQIMSHIDESASQAALLLYAAVPESPDLDDTDLDPDQTMLYPLYAGLDPDVLKLSLVNYFKNQIYSGSDCSLFLLLREIIRTVDYDVGFDSDDPLSHLMQDRKKNIH